MFVFQNCPINGTQYNYLVSFEANLAQIALLANVSLRDTASSSQLGCF